MIIYQAYRLKSVEKKKNIYKLLSLQTFQNTIPVLFSQFET